MSGDVRMVKPRYEPSKPTLTYDGQGEAADHLFAAFGDGPTDEQCQDLWCRYPSLRDWHKRTYAARPAPVPAPVASASAQPDHTKWPPIPISHCRIAQQTAPAVPAGWREAWETARQACKAGISEHRGFEIDAMVESTIISRVLVAFEALHVALSAAPKP